jgi:hypothetical protein
MAFKMLLLICLLSSLAKISRQNQIDDVITEASNEIKTNLLLHQQKVFDLNSIPGHGILMTSEG